MLALKRCLLPSIVRDVFFRLIYGEMYYNLVYHKSWLFNSKKENEKQVIYLNRCELLIVKLQFHSG